MTLDGRSCIGLTTDTALHTRSSADPRGARWRRRPSTLTNALRTAFFFDRGQRGATVDLRGAKTIMSDHGRCSPPEHRSSQTIQIDHGDQIMISPTPTARAQLRLRFALGAVVADASRRALGGATRKGWFRASSREPRRATRRPDRSAACWAARSAAWSACSPACLGSGKQRNRPTPQRTEQAARKRPSSQVESSQGAAKARRKAAKHAGGADPGGRAATDAPSRSSPTAMPISSGSRPN